MEIMSKITLPSSVVATSNDLMFEILCRLPKKSVVRFKSVSKRWEYIISDPYFSVTHTHWLNMSTVIAGTIHRSEINNIPDQILSLGIIKHDAHGTFAIQL